MKVSLRAWILPALLLIEIALFTSITEARLNSPDRFFTYFQSYFADLIAQSGPLLLLGFGMTMVLATAGIDLSVASMTALIACVMASFDGGAGFWWTAVPVGLGLGLLLGMTNGALIAFLDIPPIIATLGTMIFYRGLCFVVMGDLEKAPFVDTPGYQWLGGFAGVILLLALVYAVGGLWVRRSRWRREILLLGGNRVAARYAGVPVNRRLLQVYGLTGVMAFLAALCFTARNSSVSASSMSGMELHVIVAVVLGGARVQGGVMSISGAFLGVLLIAVLDEGLRGAAIWGTQHLPFKISHIQYLALGLLLAGGVWLNNRFGRRALLLPLLMLLCLSRTVSAQPQQMLWPETTHFGTPGEPEWVEFEGTDPRNGPLRIEFEGQRNAAERTLFIRQSDIKLNWKVELNGMRLGSLAANEQPLVHAVSLPEGILRNGRNELIITAPSQLDDVYLGPIWIDPRPRGEAVGEAELTIAVKEPGVGLIPCRLTFLDSTGALVPVNAAPGQAVAVRPGVIYTATGEVRLRTLARTVTVHANRGFEYGMASATVDLSPERSRRLDLSIAREVATPGYVAVDTHTHTFTFSRHGDASVEERVITLAGEGIEAPVATDHNYLTDYTEAAKEQGVSRWMTPIIGNEVTTSRGHFNVFPVEAGTRVADFRITDWPRLMQSIREAPGEEIIILNHPTDIHSRFRPFGAENMNHVSGETSLSGLEQIDAIELANSSAQRPEFMEPYLRWFALLNHGYRLTGVGSSDVHDVNRYIVGQGRTYVRVNDDDPSAINAAELVERLREGQALVSMGLLADLKVDGKYGPGQFATNLSNGLTLHATVAAPSWIEAETLQLFSNGELVLEVPRSSFSTGQNGVQIRYEAAISRPKHDVYFVVVASGPPVKEPHWAIPRPYQRESPHWNPRVVGSTNPIWIDGDSDGQFTSARGYAERLWSESQESLPEFLMALANYDQAVAIQSADLLRRAGHEVDSPRTQTLLRSAPPRILKAFKSVYGVEN